jgi:hypothetical protein
MPEQKDAMARMAKGDSCAWQSLCGLKSYSSTISITYSVMVPEKRLVFLSKMFINSSTNKRNKTIGGQGFVRLMNAG